MTKIFYGILSGILLLPFTFVSAEPPASSGNDYGAAKAKYVNTSGTSIPEMIGNIIKLLLSFVGGLSVLIIVIAGIMYITSGGDESRVDTAKKWIIYAIVGLVVSLLAWVIVNTVINGL